MQTSGIKIDIDKTERLFFDESEKIEKVIKFAVKQAVLQQEKLIQTKSIEKSKKELTKK